MEYKRVWASSPRAQAGLCSLREVGGSSPQAAALAGSETWGLEKSCPDPGGLQGVPGSSRGPGCSHLQAERSQLLVLGRKHVLLSAGLRDELIRGSSGCSMKALPLSQTASGFVLPALPSAGVLPASADQGTSKHSSSFPPASQHPPLLHPALQTPCGELPLPCRAPALGEWAQSCLCHSPDASFSFVASAPAPFWKGSQMGMARVWVRMGSNCGIPVLQEGAGRLPVMLGELWCLGVAWGWPWALLAAGWYQRAARQREEYLSLPPAALAVCAACCCPPRPHLWFSGFLQNTGARSGRPAASPSFDVGPVAAPPRASKGHKLLPEAWMPDLFLRTLLCVHHLHLLCCSQPSSSPRFFS